MTPLDEFYPAEDYHQDYATLNPTSLYIVINDLPKIENLQDDVPGCLARAAEARVGGEVGLIVA